MIQRCLGKRSMLLIALPSLSLIFPTGCQLAQGGANIRYDRIQQLAAGGKLILGKERGIGMGGKYASGMALQVEPGLSGGELAIGYGWSGGGIGGIYSYFPKASILRTWEDPPVGIEPNQTYAGLGIEGSFCGAYATLAVYGHVHGNDDDHPIVVSLGAGVGF